MARVAHWFRTDLRLHDNPALQAGLGLKDVEAFYPIWCWDPQYVYATRVGPNRWNFLIESMNDLSTSITALQPASQLYVLRGSPMQILRHFFKACNISHLTFEKDDDAYAMARDAEIMRIAEEAGVKVYAVHNHTLWEGAEAIKANKGQTPKTYAQYQKAVAGLGRPKRPIPKPDHLPPPADIDFTSPLESEVPEVEAFQARDMNAEHREEGKADHAYTSIAGPDGEFAVPTMKELAMSEATTFIRGGETAALDTLEEWMTVRKQEALKFEKPKTSPAAIKEAETTILSPALKFGTLSIRTFYWRIMDLLKESKGQHSEPPVSLIGQVMFRDFFHCAQTGTPNFHRIQGNPLCRYIDWDLQNQYDSSGNQLKDLVIDDSNREAYEKFMAWKEGRTGYPWIDAQMRKLKRDGWIHHLGRHSVACFLCRQLYISWERGAEVFESWLVDHDASSNEANWMWLSASAFFNQYNRVYSPITFGQKSDKRGLFIKEFCPELRDFPEKYIYAPWTAPLPVQQKAKCIVGIDYPKPIVDDKESKADSLAKIKRSYEAGLHGDDSRVLDGTASDYVKSFGDLEIHASTGKRKTKEEASDEKHNIKQQKLHF